MLATPAGVRDLTIARLCSVKPPLAAPLARKGIFAHCQTGAIRRASSVRKAARPLARRARVFDRGHITSASASCGHAVANAYRRFVPMLLKRSFCAGDQKFSGLWARFSCKDVGDLIRLTINLLTTSVTRLRAYESAVVFRAGKLEPGNLGLFQQHLP